MIVKVMAAVWKCTACGDQWFPRKDEPKELRCPNRKCRKGVDYMGKVRTDAVTSGIGQGSEEGDGEGGNV